MKRVVVTGMGIVSSIGNSLDVVEESLRIGRSGLTASPEMAEHNFRSRVYGKPTIAWQKLVPRKPARFMGDGVAWNYMAMRQAIANAELTEEFVRGNTRVGLIMGSGGPSVEAQIESAKILDRDKNPRKIGPFAVPKCMSSTASAVLATEFGIRGVNYGITSACATSAHCIGEAAQKIQLGAADLMFAGGCEEISLYLSSLFDAMGAMSANYNETPAYAGRAYSTHRDGFVIAGGAGVLLLEEYDHALARGAPLFAELLGYAATSDGFDMVMPSGEGAARAIDEVVDSLPYGRTVSYINTHGTATVVGDEKEGEAIRAVFGKNIPPFSSTKSLTGHSLGAAGVQEAIFSILMLRGGFVAGVPIPEIDPAFADLPIVQESRKAKHDVVLSNSFGFGGTNAVLAFGAC